jgi:hypothetical protein
MSSKPDTSACRWNAYTGESKSGQIASAIERAVQQGILVPGNKLPTVNNGIERFGVARKTLGDDCEIDLYFHHYNIRVFEMVKYIYTGHPVHKTIPIRFIERNSL